MAKHRPPRVAIAAVVIALVAGGIFAAWWFTRPAETSATRALSGSVEATTYTVSSVIPGRVASVSVREGKSVKAGDILVTLDDASLKLQVRQAEAGVSAAKAAVTNAKSDGTSADIAAAQARQKQAEAAVSLAQIQAGYARITAPHDGFVQTVSTNAGQAAAAGRTLVTLVDTSDLFVRAYVAEPDLGSVHIGQSATVRTDSSDRDFKGTVTFISSSAEFTPNNVETADQRTKLVFQVRVQLADTSGTLKPGMPVDVRFD